MVVSSPRVERIRLAHQVVRGQTQLKSIKSLATRYGNTITSALWRMVEDREPNRPVFEVVTLPRYPEIGVTESGQRVCYFICSAAEIPLRGTAEQRRGDPQFGRKVPNRDGSSRTT
jgi:hypothetical protein